jgi:hypothetical protein
MAVGWKSVGLELVVGCPPHVFICGDSYVLILFICQDPGCADLIDVLGGLV